MAKKILIVGVVGGGPNKIVYPYNYYLNHNYTDNVYIKKIKKILDTMITINDEKEANPKIHDNFLNIKKYKLNFDSIYFEYFPFFSNAEKMMEISYDILNKNGMLTIVTGSSSYLDLLPVLAKQINLKWKLKPIHKKDALRLIKI